MYKFHIDRGRYFEIQYLNAQKFLIPFVRNSLQFNKQFCVLEIGCGEGGVLKAFLDEGCYGVGVELDTKRFDLANDFLKSHILDNRLELFNNNIHDKIFETKFKNNFDLIILKDVIEHIHDKEKLLFQLKFYLKNDGAVFLGFPPWHMPFGGHQQIMKNAFLSKVPYLHLLPYSIFKFVLKLFKEDVDHFLEIRDSGISISQFERIIRKLDFIVLSRECYLINPIYEFKFGLKCRKQFKLIVKFPLLNNLLTTCVYFLIKNFNGGFVKKS